MHITAFSHLSSIESTCAKQQTRLTHLCGLPAKQVVEDLAEQIVALVKNAMRWLCKCALPKQAWP
eukprot:1160654-Pelagomonas_calceolata.AAC.6